MVSTEVFLLPSNFCQPKIGRSKFLCVVTLRKWLAVPELMISLPILFWHYLLTKTKRTCSLKVAKDIFHSLITDLLPVLLLNVRAYKEAFSQTCYVECCLGHTTAFVGKYKSYNCSGLENLPHELIVEASILRLCVQTPAEGGDGWKCNGGKRGVCHYVPLEQVRSISVAASSPEDLLAPSLVSMASTVAKMRFGFSSRSSHRWFVGVGPMSESADVSDSHLLQFGQSRTRRTKRCCAESVMRINARWDEKGQRRDGNCERDDEKVTSAWVKARLPLTTPLLALKHSQTGLIKLMRTPPEVNHGLEFSAGVCGFALAKTQSNGPTKCQTYQVGQRDHHECVSRPDVEIIRLHGKLCKDTEAARKQANRNVQRKGDDP